MPEDHPDGLFNEPPILSQGASSSFYKFAAVLIEDRLIPVTMRKGYRDRYKAVSHYVKGLRKRQCE